MKLYPSQPSPAQEALVESFLKNNTINIGKLAQLPPAEQEELEQQIDALPTPPAWYRAPLMSDPTQLYESFTTLTAEQIKHNVDVLVSRHVKQSYQNDLVTAGSVEQLKAHQREAHAQHEQRRQERCQAAGVPFEPDTFE